MATEETADGTEIGTSPPETIPLSESLRLLAARKACPHFTPDGSACGCRGTCAIGRGRGGGGSVDRDDCFLCIRTNGEQVLPGSPE